MQHDQNYISAEDIYRVSLSNRPDQFVTFCPAGFARARELGVGAIYMSMDGAGRYGYATWSDMTAPGEAATLARALMRAKAKERVRYRDRDVTNLRLSNLYIERGAAKASSPRKVASAGDAV